MPKAVTAQVRRAPLPPDSQLPSRPPGTYTTPPIALLDSPKSVQKIDERQLMDDARRLEARCAEFSVEGSIAQIHPGPVVTTFEFKPQAGVKYSKVTGLADDLCLAMRAESVLIERIPGKSTVGIQVPNPIRDQISLRELLESDVYRNSPSKPDPGARQDDPRRAHRQRPREDAAPADSPARPGPASPCR